MTFIEHQPQFAVMGSPGTNRDFATVAALELAGASAEILPISTLVESPAQLLDFAGLVIPGGFSHGDNIQSGVVLALHMQKMKHELMEFAFTHKRPIVGVCNGFQALVQTGLLPFGNMVPRDQLVATLTNNKEAKFESRWIYLVSEESESKYINSGDLVTFPVDHGEGRFTASPEVMAQIERQNQVVYRYADKTGQVTMDYPANPNNSTNAIAGITDTTGVIFGMMPHPEDFVRKEHYPNFRREKRGEPDGLQFFKQIVSYTKDS
jgi:phosphoribosylformylglycinamidine synthase